MFLITLLVIGIVVKILIDKNKKHKESDYYKQTGKGYFSLSGDKGSSAEFSIGKRLEEAPGYKKFIYNCYIHLVVPPIIILLL